MKSSKYQWQMPESAEPSSAFLSWLDSRGYSPLLGDVLWRRGIQSETALERFFSEDISGLYDPFLMHDMEKAVARIQQAVIEGEGILVYGDYDADGITSTTLLKETLDLLGADVQYFLPNRFEQGYGPNLEKYKEIVEAGIRLIITVDNGVAGHDAIDYAQSHGVDVIVTDHHELPQVLPEAYAVVHPRHPAGNYPFGELAGVGVAFKMATALLEEPPYEFLDLAAIGTIADLVSLTDENRLLVKLGLKAISRTERIGLIKLFEKSGADITKVTETNIGFGIAPRLNAIGRLGDPNPAVELMSTFDDEEAEKLAEFLNKKNEERKQIVEDITGEALTMTDSRNQIHVLARAGWHEGVLGIVAGNIVKETGKPAILLTIKEDGTAKGSGRSVDALNLFKCLDTMRDLFLHFGGHHAAVGLTMEAVNADTLQQRLNEYTTAEQIDLASGSLLFIDGVIDPAKISVPLIENLNQLAPFGTDNPLPTFIVKDIQPSNVKVLGANHQHLKFSFSREEELEVIAFSFGSQAEEFHDIVDIAGQLTINEWNGMRKPQIQLADYRVKGFQFFDWRGKKNWHSALDAEKTLLLAFHSDSCKILEPAMQNRVVVFESLDQLGTLIAEKHFSQLAILDMPKNLEEMRAVLKSAPFSRLYFYGYSKDEAYLNGMGSREQYGRLFKLIQQQSRLDVRYKLNQVADFLKIPKSLLVFMIKVFSELKFVKIDDGILYIAEVEQKHPLTESSVYQKRLQQIKNEEFLLLSDSTAIKDWLQQE